MSIAYNSNGCIGQIPSLSCNHNPLVVVPFLWESGPYAGEPWYSGSLFGAFYGTRGSGPRKPGVGVGGSRPSDPQGPGPRTPDGDPGGPTGPGDDGGPDKPGGGPAGSGGTTVSTGESAMSGPPSSQYTSGPSEA